MIPKGNQRAGGQQLATHLLNAYDNDSVEVADVRGAIAQDLHGAFAEWYAEAKATKCSKFLYSLSINPDHTQGPFNREHYYDFIHRTENMLGLSGQPRAVVFHVKHGREHCHVVWSRIDTEKMKAVQLSHDRQKLRAVAQEYARDHNLTLPPGMQNNRGKDRFPDHAKTENLAEKQQEERTGTSKKQRMAMGRLHNYLHSLTVIEKMPFSIRYLQLYALHSKSVGRKAVWVRLPPPAPKQVASVVKNKNYIPLCASDSSCPWCPARACGLWCFPVACCDFNWPAKVTSCYPCGKGSLRIKLVSAGRGQRWSRGGGS
jgi:hypothetical protein